MESNRFLQKLNQGGTIICAEGYLFEMQRRGYLSDGVFMPECVLTHPHAVKQLTREFVDCGSDIILAFTFYGHREKLRAIGKEDQLELLNRTALEIAWEVQKEEGNQDCLVAGNISNTNLMGAGDFSTNKEEILTMFREQAKWCKEANVDLILCETFSIVAEALLSVQACKEVDIPCVVNMAFTKYNDETRDGYTPEDAMKKLQAAGAAVVGSNCFRGSETMMPIMKKIRAAVDGPIAAVPVPYKTSEKSPNWFMLPNVDKNYPCDELGRAFPGSLENYIYTRWDVEAFAKEAQKIGIQFVGLCCGSSPYLTRQLAEAFGRKTRASYYNIDLKKNTCVGVEGYKKNFNQDIVDEVKEVLAKLKQ